MTCLKHELIWLPQMKEFQKLNSITSFVAKIKSRCSVMWVCFKTNTYKRSRRQKRPRRRFITRTLERSPVIHLQTVAQDPRFRSIGDVGVIYCHVDAVAGCYLDEPSTVLIVEILYRVVGASNKTSVVIPVKVTICCVQSVISVASFNDKRRGKSLS